MKERIFNNWKTSLIGIVLVLVALLFVWFGKITWTNFCIFLPTCLGFIYVKDSVLTVNAKPEDQPVQP